MSSRDDHIAIVEQLDRWLDHINYEQIKDDIPDREEDAIAERSVIYIQNVPDHLVKTFTVICKAFPELKDDDIRLVFRKIPMTMQARPDIWSLLIGRKKYIILINNQRSNNGITLDDIPFNGQLGIIAHECCHILDYTHKSIWGIIKTGIMYLSPHKREHYEKATDYLAVKKGFGLQLHTWANYVLDEAPIAEKYRATKEKYYLSPNLISWMIKKLDEAI